MLQYKAIHTLLPFCATALLAAAPVAGAPQTGSATATPLGEITATFVKTIDTKRNKAGDRVTAKSIVGTTLLNGLTVPVGSVLEGQINSVVPSENQGDSTLVITFDKLAIKNGKELPVKATVLTVMSAPPVFRQEPVAVAPLASRVGEPIGHSHIPENRASGSHTISGLTMSSSAKDSTSAILTQTRKDIHLTSDVQVTVSLAAVPSP